MTFRALQEIPWSLSGIHGRKALIWATGGLPFQLDSPDSVPGGWLSLLYERAAAALNDAQVAVWRCSSLKLVLSSMAVGAQGDEVFCRVVSQPAAESPVVDLQVSERPAPLTAPSVSL